jgi:hypothetical protein
MRRDACQSDPGPGGRVERRLLVDVVGQPGKDMETGRRPDRAHIRQVTFKSIEECVAAFAIDRPEPAEVMVELPSLDEVRERELVDGRRTLVRRPFRLSDGGGHPWWDGEPSEAKARRKHLARRAGVDDPLRIEPLDGTDRLTIEAEFRVVVILDDDCAPSRCPCDQGGTAVGWEHSSGRVLVGRRDDDGIDGDVFEGVHHQPGMVDRDADQLES